MAIQGLYSAAVYNQHKQEHCRIVQQKLLIACEAAQDQERAGKPNKT